MKTRLCSENKPLGKPTVASRQQGSHDFFQNHTKSKVFQTHGRQRALFSKFDVKLESWGIQALTHSLRGPAQFTHEARSDEFTGGWVDGLMGWTEYQKRPSIFFILCG